jgi:DEAD/DEAH box helicase domain-containing protein
MGRSYEVRELDLDARRALVAPFDGNWYTQPKKETRHEIERLLDRRSVLGVTLSFGTVTVTEEVHAYQRKRLPDHEVIDLPGSTCRRSRSHPGALVRGPGRPARPTTSR